MAPTRVVINTSPGLDNRVVSEIKAAIPKSIDVRQGIYLQAAAGISPEAIVIVFFFASNFVIKGFLEDLGKEAYQKLKVKLRNFLSAQKERTLVLDFKSKKTSISFRCETDDKDA